MVTNDPNTADWIELLCWRKRTSAEPECNERRTGRLFAGSLLSVIMEARAGLRSWLSFSSECLHADAKASRSHIAYAAFPTDYKRPTGLQTAVDEIRFDRCDFAQL